MAQSTSDGQLLDSSMRRLSLAPIQARPTRVSSRTASGTVIAGRPYDQLPPGAAPSAWPTRSHDMAPVQTLPSAPSSQRAKEVPTSPRSHQRGPRTTLQPASTSSPERMSESSQSKFGFDQREASMDSRSPTYQRHGIVAPKSQPAPIADQSPRRSSKTISEASAYAMAVAPNLVRSPQQHERKNSRPLPRPPSGQMNPASGSNPLPFEIEFSRSPTLPDLTDPRADTRLKHVVSRSKPLEPNNVRATEQRTAPSRPAHRAYTTSRTTGRRTSACLRALSIPSVQAALLPFLPINSFLSLTGSSERLRKCFSGEVVGRWVVQSWGIQLGREKGRSWPNLTVWEGFLESLLHDPATYSTYSGQWHSLLSHLCLSHTLIVLHLRNLPPASFPTTSPFDEEGVLKQSSSLTSLVSLRPHSRMSSAIGSDYSALQTKPPKPERLVEIIMPEPLAAQPSLAASPENPSRNVLRRRSSIGSMASGISLVGRKRSNSEAAKVVPGKMGLPPVSYPTPKRYGFRGPSTTPRSSMDGGRPGSLRPGSVYSAVTAASHRKHSTPLVENLVAPRWHRKSMSSSEASRPRSEWGGSPNPWGGSPNPDPRREARIEPAFDKQPPYSPGRAPILRVYIPISDKLRRWPSAEAAAATVRELDKCGATRKLRLGDLIVNTAIHQPKTTEHVLIYVPFLKHLLVPLEYKFMPTGHLPSYIDAFQLPPSYYYPFLPAPQIVFLNLSAFAERALRSVRLAYDGRDVTTASGARLSAKRYLHVTGFEIIESDHPCAEWRGMISLEAEGTLEGKTDLERQFMSQRTLSGPWELVRDKSMPGSVWLRLRKQM